MEPFEVRLYFTADEWLKIKYACEKLLQKRLDDDTVKGMIIMRSHTAMMEFIRAISEPVNEEE